MAVAVAGDFPSVGYRSRRENCRIAIVALSVNVASCSSDNLEPGSYHHLPASMQLELKKMGRCWQCSGAESVGR